MFFFIKKVYRLLLQITTSTFLCDILTCVVFQGKQLIGGDDGHRSEQDIAAEQHFHKRSLFGMTIQM